MSVFSIGDQARSYALQSSVRSMKKTLDVLGVVAEVSV